MKKKYFYILAAALIAVVTSCSLYLEEDDIRTLHTEDGYTNDQTINNSDGTTVTYQYNQRTIPIDDEVEEYIVKVESDTILYFVDGTPDHLLPEEGEMMVCSFRDRFPHAFCHRCIERTQVNGLYRCVFTRCSLKEAFDKLEVTTTVTENNYILPEGVTPIDEEEMDSVMSASEFDTPEEAEAAARRWRNPVPTRGWLTDWNPDLSKKSIKLGVKTTLELSAYKIAKVSASVEGTITLGTNNVVKYSREHEELEVATGLFGKLDLTFQVTADADLTIQSPVAIPIIGAKVDLLVVGVEAGLTANPYVTTKQTVAATMHVCHGFNFVWSYKNVAGKSSAEVQGDNEKKSKVPVFYCNFNTGTSRTLNVQMGLDFRLGIGVHALKTGGEAAVGLKLYSEVNQDMDDKKFHSAKEFRDKNANFPTYVQLYAEGSLEFLGAGVSLNQSFDPYACKILKIPYFPKIDPSKCSFYCSRHSPRTFKVKGALEELGLLGAIYTYEPVVRIYNRMSDEAHNMGFEDELVEEFKLKWKDGLYDFVAEERSNNIQFNADYYAQFALDTELDGMSELFFGDDAEFYWPLYDMRFRVTVPEIYLTYADDIYHDYGPFQKVVKGTENDVLPQYVTYNYCYTIDVMAQIHDSREIKKWGIHMNDNYCNDIEFEKNLKAGKEISEAVVRFYWYTNRRNVHLSFWGYCWAGKEQDRIKFTDDQHSTYINIEYNPNKSYRSPTDDTPDYDSELDNDRKARMMRPYSDDDVIMSFVDASTGDYCEVVSVTEK